jgi:hypothetical protein
MIKTEVLRKKAKYGQRNLSLELLSVNNNE